MYWHLMPRDNRASSLVVESITCHNLILLERQQRPCLSGCCIIVSEQAPGSLFVQFHFLTVSITC